MNLEDAVATQIGDYVVYELEPIKYQGRVLSKAAQKDGFLGVISTTSWAMEFPIGLAIPIEIKDRCISPGGRVVWFCPPKWLTRAEAPVEVKTESSLHIAGLDVEVIDADAYREFMRGL